MTAVEWLINELENGGYAIYIDDNDMVTIKIPKKIITQAKEMEKEQMIDAFGVGCHLESKRLIGYHDIAEHYYNETYGGEQ